MARAAPGSGASPLPLLPALALGKWPHWALETREESLGWSRKEGKSSALAFGLQEHPALAGAGRRTCRILGSSRIQQLGT